MFELARETENGLRVADYHLPLVDGLLQEAELKQVAPEFEQRRIALRSFDRIQSQPIPAKFQVDLFQTDLKVRFYLISLKAGGVGLNRTAADDVIHLNPWWNPVEEKILHLQEPKRALVDQLISTENRFFKSLSADDVKVLFS